MRGVDHIDKAQSRRQQVCWHSPAFNVDRLPRPGGNRRFVPSLSLPAISGIPHREKTRKGGEALDKSGKEQLVTELAGKLSAARATFLADYRGLSVEAATDLRKKLHEAGVEYRVVKNTLLRLASKGTDVEGLDDYFSGPTAIAIVGDDPVAPAKVLADMAKDSKVFELKAGTLGAKVITAADIEALAKLPSREELLAKMLSTLNAPASNFVGTLGALPRQMVQVLSAIKDQKPA